MVAQQQLDAQALLQRIDAAPHDGRRRALGLGGRGEAAARGHGDEEFSSWSEAVRSAA